MLPPLTVPIMNKNIMNNLKFYFRMRYLFVKNLMIFLSYLF
jgi:hypothetical protein